MHRIDNATAAAGLPAPIAAGTPGYFSKGNPTGGVPATVVTDDWANAVQEELAYVIEQAGLTLSKTDRTQLRQAVILAIAGSGAGSPSGALVPYAGIALPSGHLWADGAAVSRATYANLFAALIKSGVATMTIASPSVFSWNGHGLKDHYPITITTTGALPTGLASGVTYYLRNTTTNTFQVSLVPGGAAVATSGTQSGVHTVLCAPFGNGDGSTTFNTPTAIGRQLLGSGLITFAETIIAANVNTGTDLFTVLENNAKWITGMAVVLTTSGGAPAGLVAGTTYYIVRNSTNSIKLALSLANAQNGTVIDITTQGTGNHTLTWTGTARALGEIGGEEQHAMSLTELLAHSHAENAPSILSGGVLTAWTLDSGAGSGTSAVGLNTGAAGGNAAMNNLEPYLGVNWLVKT